MIYKLKKGDEVEIVAPSSYIENQFEYLQGIQIIRDWGLSVNQKNIQNRRFGYFAGDDNTRLSEVRNSQNSKLIIFAKGGWGSARLLERDIAWAETWMLGFSDTCSLLLSKYSNLEIVSNSVSSFFKLGMNFFNVSLILW